MAACGESLPERDARERRERSERDLARLLKTRVCVRCRIYGANLVGRDLRGIKLHHSVLNGNLQRADLRGARVNDSSIGGDLRGLDLRGATAQAMEFRPGNGLMAGARLDELDLRSTRFSEDTDWRGAVLAGANLAGLNFGIWGGPRRRMEVPKGCLKGADLRGANLAGAWLSFTDLRDADLRGADLREANLPESDHVVGANFEGAIAPNGKPCAPTSIGRCITGKREQPPWR